MFLKTYAEIYMVLVRYYPTCSSSNAVF